MELLGGNLRWKSWPGVFFVFNGCKSSPHQAYLWRVDHVYIFVCMCEYAHVYWYRHILVRSCVVYDDLKLHLYLITNLFWGNYCAWSWFSISISSWAMIVTSQGLSKSFRPNMFCICYLIQFDENFSLRRVWNHAVRPTAEKKRGRLMGISLHHTRIILLPHHQTMRHGIVNMCFCHHACCWWHYTDEIRITQTPWWLYHVVL